MTAVLAGRVPSEPVSITAGVAVGDELAVGLGLGLGDELAVEVGLGAGVAAPAAAEVPSSSADVTATPASRLELVLTLCPSVGAVRILAAGACAAPRWLIGTAGRNLRRAAAAASCAPVRLLHCRFGSCKAD
jgi:hypothetical protein